MDNVYNSNSFLVCFRVVFIKKGKILWILVCICNLLVKLIKVLLKFVICKLSFVKVVNVWYFLISFIVILEVDLVKLGVKINEGNLLLD